MRSMRLAVLDTMVEVVRDERESVVTVRPRVADDGGTALLRLRPLWPVTAIRAHPQ
jgi:hypothetical protein